MTIKFGAFNRGYLQRATRKKDESSRKSIGFRLGVNQAGIDIVNIGSQEGFMTTILN